MQVPGVSTSSEFARGWRLENGAFKWPPIVDGVMRMNAAQLAARH
jgi:transposase